MLSNTLLPLNTDGEAEMYTNHNCIVNNLYDIWQH